MTTRECMNVLVTGGSGFVGSHVIRQLIHRGHRVVATATGRRCNHASNGNLRWLCWDASQERLPALSWSDLDAVVHLAKPAASFDFPRNADATYEVLVSATFRLLEAARANGC